MLRFIRLFRFCYPEMGLHADCQLIAENKMRIPAVFLFGKSLPIRRPFEFVIFVKIRPYRAVYAT